MAKKGYARVSYREQNLQRQFELLENISATKIFLDKLSGKDNNRHNYKRCLTI